MGEFEEVEQGAKQAKREDNQSVDECNSRAIYYGVYIPPERQAPEGSDECAVFTDKEEALKLVKKYKKARFKAFELIADAFAFADNGSECLNANYMDPNKSQECHTVGEKSSPFRGPSSQNLVKLRKGIETGDIDFVYRTVWDNPRYLIGSGDTPSILQEGFRYNALHVAAKAKNANMCDLIVNTIADLRFISKLYVDGGNPAIRAHMLLDLYFNTPDKGLNETPLHFAVKFGALQCVEVLTSNPYCDKNLRNKYGNLPKQIICDRYNGPDAKAIFEQIAVLLDENFYVPVIRAEDNCAPPTIGEPFSPTSPPNLNRDPLSPRMEIHAYAGPMDKEGADKFRKMWKTPPRVLRSTKVSALKFRDHVKGLERVGDSLAKQMNVEWKEYWPFLDNFIDLASTEGLQMFEKYMSDKLKARFSFQQRSNQDSPMMDLCRALEACEITDKSPNSFTFDQTSQYYASPQNGVDHHSESTLNPQFCIEKSLQVFANRIAYYVSYLLETDYDTFALIETQVQQLHALMDSYMEDNRFQCVDRKLAHPRLAVLIRMQLGEFLNAINVNNAMSRINAWLDLDSVDFCEKTHMRCILNSLRECLNNNCAANENISSVQDCVDAWNALTTCECNFDAKTGRKFNGMMRPKKFTPFFKKDLVKKLRFDEDDELEESDDEFFTPPSSPSLLEVEDMDEDEFHEAYLKDIELFIQGDEPSKVDNDAFNALKYVECVIKPEVFPNIYRWQHAVGVFSETERSKWGTPAINKLPNNAATSTPVHSPNHNRPSNAAAFTTSPPLSSGWKRITGPNSPRACFRSKQNVSFDL